VDILVNNAAMSFTPTPLAELDEETYDRALTVNLKAAFLTVRYAARHMPDGGRIVNVSTLNTQRAGRGIAPYMMSKGALEQLTAAAAVDLGPRGITVNTVSPGATDTDLLRGTNPPEALDMVVQLTSPPAEAGGFFPRGLSFLLRSRSPTRISGEGRCAAHRSYISSTDLTSRQPGGRPDRLGCHQSGKPDVITPSAQLPPHGGGRRSAWRQILVPCPAPQGVRFLSALNGRVSTEESR
jgi:NAD(P)-dependent dehydrogenase (short-subunit alcohol dehydrogenase family)